MKLKSLFISAAIGLTLVLAGIVATLPLTGCDGNVPCCPKISDFKSVYEWVCTQPGCGDPGTKVIFKVIYHQGTTNYCTMSNIVDQVKLENVTEGYTVSSSNWQETSTGNVETLPGGTFVKIQQLKGDITLRLTATGEQGCSTEKEEITVKVVESGSKDTLCFKIAKDTKSIFWTGTTDIFGPKVVIDHIVNSNPFMINAKLDAYQELSIDRDKPAFQNHHVSPNGKWTLEIVDQTKRQEYLNSGQDLCIVVYLTCKCP